MYPRRALTDLARRKARLRESIAVRRAGCTDAAARVLEPLRCWDLAYLAWKNVSPLAKAVIPAGAGFLAAFLPRQKWARRLRRWLPVAIVVLRVVCVLREVRLIPAQRAGVPRAAQ